MPTFSFRAKVETVFNMDDSEAYKRVKVPAPTRAHCDMHEFRTAPRWRGLANSDLFPAMLKRGLKAAGIGTHIRLDQIPEGVAIDTTGFLASVEISLT